MYEKQKPAFSGKKAKIVCITLCVVLTLSAGAMTALAATSENFPVLPFLRASGKASSLAIRSDDGETAYSTDGGETWSGEAPEGVTISEDGNAVSYSVSVDADYDDVGDAKRLHVMDGDNDFKEVYITTWAMPEDSFEGFSPEDFDCLHMLRFVDGVIYHSPDGGETWIEGLPEDMIQEGASEFSFSFESEDGSSKMTITHNIEE